MKKSKLVLLVGTLMVSTGFSAAVFADSCNCGSASLGMTGRAFLSLFGISI